MGKFAKKACRKRGDLDAALWKLFSKFVRLRDADEYGMCRCITCGRLFYWLEGDAGHFITRDHKATKFHPMNVHAQCPMCNRFKSGEQYKFGQAIDRILGAGTADTLNILAHASATCKLDFGYYQHWIGHYKSELKRIKLERPHLFSKD